jgi:FkbM family methyltransferase
VRTLGSRVARLVHGLGIRRAAGGHSIFSRFAPFEGWAEPGFERGFYGVNIRDWLHTGESKGYRERRQVFVGPPSVDEEYFEWIALLSAVATAGDRFCLAELGAGWGRWMAAAAALCRQRGLPFTLIGVEAEPSHYEWIRMVFRDNDIDPDGHHLLCGAVADRDCAEVLLSGPDPPEKVWGHRTVRPEELPQWESLPGYRTTKVPGFSLATILAPCQHVDLVDVDIQGVECDVLAPAFETLNAKVSAVHVGTHSVGTRSTDAPVRRLFKRHGWLNAFMYHSHSEARTRFGRVRFVDGAQTWVNPARRDLLDVLRDRPARCGAVRSTFPVQITN